MNTLLSSFSEPALRLPRPIKQIIAGVVDASLCSIATWLAFYLRLDTAARFGEPLFLAGLTSFLIALPIFSWLGLYRAIFRFSGWPAVLAVAQAMTLYSLIFATIFTVIGVHGVPRTVGLIQPIVLFLLVSGSRLFVRVWLGDIYKSRVVIESMPRVLIYGAGSAGRQLASTIRSGRDMALLGFIDDDSSLDGLTMDGVKVFESSSLKSLVEALEVTHVFLAMPLISRKRRNAVIAEIASLNVVVKSLPMMSEIVDGRVTVTDLQELDTNDLLGREPVPMHYENVSNFIARKTILVTGAGGSIGAELCRQIVMFDPDMVILVESNEYALYSAMSELDSASIQKNISFIPILASVQDRPLMSIIFNLYKPNIVFHAAAYKHVHLVELNIVEAVKNNVLGTISVAEAAKQSGVSSFVLISTDKAVRPSNVMGATKRLAEMIVQTFNAREGCKTRFSMVRFGNVLASSGSVIPKFQEQIRKGGPITVTHPEVNRFFMTITEAAQLVIQAGSMAEGGEVFLLDMGKPVKIMDLAKRMINLSGLKVSEKEHDGDISIKITGLGPGEKLFEELLLSNNPLKTEHPRILKGSEEVLDWTSLEQGLDLLKLSIERNDQDEVLSVLHNLVRDFRHSNIPVN
jgi:FlaA1/EpsC-like NDP-sugar epimerase